MDQQCKHILHYHPKPHNSSVGHSETSLLFEARRRKVVLTQQTLSGSNGFCVHPASNYSGVCPAGKLSKHHGRMIIKVREENIFAFGLYSNIRMSHIDQLCVFIYVVAKMKSRLLVYVAVNNQGGE